MEVGKGVTNMWAQHLLQTSFRNVVPKNQFNNNPFLVNYPAEPSITPATNEIEFTPPSPPPPTVASTSLPPPTVIFTSPPRIQTKANDFSDCGISAPQHLVFGNKTQPGQFPWLVALYLKERSSYNFICTANLISNRLVLTAAHCVAEKSRQDLLCVLGKHNISHWAKKSVLRDVKTINIYNDYKKNALSSHADVAILVLEEVVVFQSILRPVCLWKEDDNLDGIVGQWGTVAGWGKTDLENNFSDEPKVAEMPIVRTDTCYQADQRYAFILSNTTFCAGG